MHLISPSKFLIIVGSLLLLSTASSAQSGPGGYPNRPVKLVVPAAQGSLTDPVARVIADAMKLRTGQPWIVENRPGAGGSARSARI